MRYLYLVAIFLIVPLTATAQDGRDRRRSEQRPSAQSPSNPTLPPWEQKQTPWWERQAPPSWERPTDVKQPQNPPLPNWATRTQPNHQETNRPHDRDGRGTHQRQYSPSVVYVLPPYRFFPNTYPATNQFYVAPPPPTAPVAEPAAPMGALRLDVEPRDLLQVFVDGSFVGMPSEIGDQIELTPGTRRIELRARGYKTLTFNAEIVKDREITYRGSLERDAPQTPAPEAPAPQAPKPHLPPQAPRTPTTIYLIPGCYLGNVAPKLAELRPGCDIGKLTKTSP